MVEDSGPPAGSPKTFGAHFLPFATLTFLIFIIDQATKLLIVTNLRLFESIPDDGILRLTYVTNSGSAFGMLRGQTEFLILVSLIGILGVLFYYRANGRESALLRYSLALLLGGALGNLTDRLLRGAVVDFISVRVWSDYYFPTFNIADSALTVGLFALAAYVLMNRSKNRTFENPSPDHDDGIPSSQPSLAEGEAWDEGREMTDADATDRPA